MESASNVTLHLKKGTLLLLGQPMLFILCGVINISASVTYICLLYILRYIDLTSSVKGVFFAWEGFLFFCFALETIINFSTSFNKAGYIISFTGITDIASLLVFIAYLTRDPYAALTFQFVRCFRLLKLMQGVKSFPQVFDFLFLNPMPYEILHTVTCVIVLLLVMTGAIQALSYRYPESFDAPLPLWQLNSGSGYQTRFLFWHECLYFVVVTVTTVGFGDIFPVSTLSRMLMVLIIITAFCLIPPLISDLVRAFYSRPLYAGSLSLHPGRKHILICGLVNSAMVLQLLFELESHQQPSSSGISLWTPPDHNSNTTVRAFSSWGVGSTGNSVLVVILSPHLPNRKVKLLLDAVLASYARRVVYFVGSTKVVQDLERVKLADALAVLVLGDEPTTSMRVEEDSTVLSSISISNFLEHSHSAICGVSAKSPRPHLVTMLTHTSKLRPLLNSAGVDVVLPFQHFKYSVLGVSVACPGFLALFMKLNRPHFETYARQYPHYLSGHNKTFFHATAASNALDNLPYSKSTETEHSIYQVCVFAEEQFCCSSSEEGGREKGNVGDDPELAQLVNRLPDTTLFQDFVSIVFRLSHGEVVLIGAKCKHIAANSHPHHQHQLKSFHEIHINPGRSAVVNQCSSLFCIAKSRVVAVLNFKLACQRIASGAAVEGPRGWLELGSLESLGENFLLGQRSSGEDGDVFLYDHATRSDVPNRMKDLRKGLGAHDPPIGHACVQTIAKKPHNVDSPVKKRRKLSRVHRKSLKKNSRSSPISRTNAINSKNLKKLCPFSFADDDSVSGGHSVASGKEFVKYGSSSSRHTLPTSFLSRDKTKTLRDNIRLRSNSNKHGSMNPKLKKSPSKVNGRAANSLGGFEDVSSSETSQKLKRRERGSPDELNGHLVLLLSFSGTKETISAHTLLLPIVHILTSYRAHSTKDKVIILSERADELHTLAADSSVAHQDILSEVYYYVGSPRNMDHLQICSVATARAVVTFHHPTPSTVFVQGDDDPSGNTVPRKLNADRHTIIVGLNLHFLLEKQKQLPRHGGRRGNVDVGGFLRNDSYCPFTFTVTEVRHESNVAYLWRSISTISSAPSHRTPPVSLRHAHNHASNCFDMLSAGMVMTAPVFVSLLLQSILNPDVVTLWEHMLSASCRVSDPEPSSNSPPVVPPQRETRSPSPLNHTSFSPRYPELDTPILTSHNSDDPTSPHKDYAWEERPGNSLPLLGRIACPALYSGLIYGLLFEDLLERSGVICIGVHRLAAEVNEGSESSYGSAVGHSKVSSVSSVASSVSDDDSKESNECGAAADIPAESDAACSEQGQEFEKKFLCGQRGYDADEETCHSRHAHTLTLGCNAPVENDDDSNHTFPSVSTTSAPPAVAPAATPYVFIAPAGDFVMDENDYILILRRL